MSDWYPQGLEDDLRPRLFAALDRGEAAALVTIAAAEGGGPRGVGAQMVVTADDMGGFLSGGCIEADVALHARECLADGRARRLIYGRGSPFVDTRLPCGGRLDLLVERIAPGDAAAAGMRAAWAARRPGVYRSDGERRRFDRVAHGEGHRAVGAQAAGDGELIRPYPPRRRLVVVGGDPFALAIAAAGLAQEWETVLLRPVGPEAPPPLALDYRRGPAGRTLAELALDPWTAVAVATHDADLDHEALAAALPSSAGYVGVLGARRRLPERLARLREAGVEDAALARLRAPIGLAIAARSPAEVATAVTAQIVAVWNGA